MPNGATITVWGYVEGACSAVTAPGGPVIYVNQGDVVTVNLQNGLATEDTALLFQGSSSCWFWHPPAFPLCRRVLSPLSSGAGPHADKIAAGTTGGAGCPWPPVR